MPIIFILKRLANFNKLVSSDVFPELEITIRISFFSIWPASPCETPVESTKKLGIPTLEKVAAAFLQIKEFLPTPEKITLPLQFIIKSTALTKELLKTFFIFFNSLIWIFAALLAKDI